MRSLVFYLQFNYTSKQITAFISLIKIRDDFRRAFALEAHSSGIPILVISKLLGHSQVSTTTRYLNIDENDLRREYTKLCLFT